MGTVIRPEVSVRNKYWLPRHRYYELRHFCLQYPEWKKLYFSLSGMSVRISSLTEHISGGEMPNPTAVYAEARIYCRDRMEMVETAAQEAAGEMQALMLKAVTQGLSYDIVSPPCCKDVWYVAYRRFFWLLDKKRK